MKSDIIEDDMIKEENRTKGERRIKRACRRGQERKGGGDKDEGNIRSVLHSSQAKPDGLVFSRVQAVQIH